MFTKKETNFCKGIAIILMLFHHLFDDYGEYEGYIVNFFPFNAERVRFLAVLAKLCVSIFVFISGYGIAASYRKKFADTIPDRTQVVKFIWDRLWKLMIGYWFAFILTLICQPLGRTIFDAYGTSMKDIAVYGLIDVLGLSLMFGTPTLNPTWWYITLAITIILVMPVVMRIMDKFGNFTVLLGSLLVFYMLGANTTLTFYMFSMILGVVCYRNAFFQKLDNVWKKRKYGVLWKALFEVLLVLILLSCRMNYNYYGVIDGFLALVIAMFASTVGTKIPVVTNVLQFLGKHSANMFMMHNQIYSYYFLGFFYSCRHWLLILTCLTVVSLLVSILMETLKKYIGYQNAMEKLGDIIWKKAV